MSESVPEQSPSRRRFLLGTAAVAGSAALPAPSPAGGPKVLVLANNVGYEPTAAKRVVIASAKPGGAPKPYQVVDNTTGQVVSRGLARYVGPVKDWLADQVPAVPSYYWVADLASVTTLGQYVVTVDGWSSQPFWIEPNVLERRTMSHLVHYFKDSRSSGQYDKADRALPLKSGGTFDAHGGWYDAAADWGKHFTQLSNLSYFNTLSIPLTAWALAASHDQLAKRNNTDLVAALGWIQDEALFGADYLTRVHVKGGSFYSSVGQPEADDLGADPTKRTLSTRQVDFREGGGLAIAALARSSTYPVSGDYSSAEYLAAAEDAFAYLLVNNVSLLNDGKENILDDFNALLAATELFKATKKDAYRSAADARAASLCGRLVSWQGYRDYWRADDVDRPFFHPSDAGLPVVGLLTYLDIVTDAAVRAKVLGVVQRAMQFELTVTAEVPNPFGYARQLVQDNKGTRYSAFFFPHNVTPRTDDAWWQGENARLASLASAARLAATFFTGAFAASLRAYAQDQLNWIVGSNPFDVCMLEGTGRDQPLYLEYADGQTVGSWRWLRSAGGIVNGITGKSDDGRGLAWDPGAAFTGPNTDWRWLEQWLPHSTWFLYAASIG
ncbi:glycoside hydrolase family 9 protein [Kutzneria buriramensis]|uniref:Cellulase-like Ig domain-containing protein n=1 Tax=Kutzneria buriramensis TaxID=1045776 RepID=A0A3E0GVN3_9PSEU|nr:glycoside hydrolase family 9 protein [Kutzneria buriramensis]REH27075.1 cellulase-like Ig domain-containing protein [Kutzneria buriramensis]